MIADAIIYTRKYKACQIHMDFIHQPPELLHPTVASWPFEELGIVLWDPSVLHRIEVIGSFLR